MVGVSCVFALNQASPLFHLVCVGTAAFPDHVNLGVVGDGLERDMLISVQK